MESPRATGNATLSPHPPPIVGVIAEKPEIMKAIEDNSVSAIRKVLSRDPHAAMGLFWDHGIEAPIVCAMRNRCDYEVIQLLLSAGADIFAENYEGLTPMQLLVGQGRGGRLIRYEHDLFRAKFWKICGNVL